jgi:hypothetical protein
MKIYVDCLSGVDHLSRLSNKRFNELKQDLTLSKQDEIMNVIDHFSKCYFNGFVSSKCGRRVIDSILLVNNINESISTLNTKLSQYDLQPIFEAAFKGVMDNCADLGCEYYFPA